MAGVWNEAERWLPLRDEAGCPICIETRPRDVIAELEATWITAAAKAPLPGYACVVSKRHAVEPFELSPSDRIRFFEDAMDAARALAELFQPIKMNYQINGNTIPHLHMHLYPRFPGDPFVGVPIDGGAATFVRTVDDLAQIRRALTMAA